MMLSLSKTRGQALPYSMSEKYASRLMTADEAVSLYVHSGQRIFLHGGAATPWALVDAMKAQRARLLGVEWVSISTQGGALVTEEDRGHFFANSLFVSAANRHAVNAGGGDYVPIFLSEIPRLFRSGLMPIDVCMLHVSPPDTHGYCSLGVSVDVAQAALASAKIVIAQVNPLMPRTHGDGALHISQVNAFVYHEASLPSLDYGAGAQDPVTQSIGQKVAELVEDGATLQMGIGAIPDSVLSCLTQHRNLGVHTEMFSDGVISLVEKGIITNSEKKVLPGKIVTGFLVGTQALYDFVDDNPIIAVKPIDFVNDTAIIRKNPKVAAINSALQVDLTGQICADSLGTYQYSGVGGQMDFIRGAALSEGGKPIIALPSVTKKGISKIMPELTAGAGVTTTRAHAHYVVTEYGVAYLFGKNLKQRAEALIQIAHPDHREDLARASFERFGR